MAEDSGNLGEKTEPKTELTAEEGVQVKPPVLTSLPPPPLSPPPVPVESKPGPATVKKSKKSFIPTRDAKTGSKDSVPEDSVTSSPAVRNAVKDIIRLLKGLDKIGGNPDTTDYYGAAVDDIPPTPNSPDFTAEEDTPDGGSSTTNYRNELNQGDTSLTSVAAYHPHPENSTTVITPHRPVRVSHVILKHEDPTFTKVINEPFDPELVDPSSRSRDTRRASIAETRQKKPVINASEVAETSTDRRRRTQQLGHQSEQPNTTTKVRIQRKDLLPSLHRPPRMGKTGGNLSRDAELVKFNRAAAQKALEKARQPEEEQTYSYQRSNTVYREPNLNIFLPVEAREIPNEGSLWDNRATSRHENPSGTPPENFGAPYFRLDGSVLEDATITRAPIATVDIHRLVKRAVQEQQLRYLEATESARHHNRRIIHNHQQLEHAKESAKKTRRRLP